MAVIHIFGAAGSGTTTLAAELCKRFGYEHLDTDDYFWMPSDPPYTVKRPKEERLALMKKALDRSGKSIISGSLCGWGDELIPYFNFAIRLVTSTGVRIHRLKKRELQNFGSRILEGGDMYFDHLEFLQWASEYDTGDASMRSVAMHDQWMKQLSCPYVILDGTMSLSRLTEEVALNYPIGS